MEKEMDYLTVALYAKTDADAEEESRRRVEVFYAAQDLAPPSSEMTAALMALLVPVPTTHDLERVYRLEIPFGLRYKPFGELSALDLEQINRFLKANCDQRGMEGVLFRQRAEPEFGKLLQWQNLSKILDWLQTDQVGN